jgi:hypothetical protein
LQTVIEQNKKKGFDVLHENSGLKLNFVQNVEPDPREIGQKEVFCKGLVEKLREMRSLMRVNLLNLLMADGEGIFI